MTRKNKAGTLAEGTILHIETATDVCAVALSRGEELLVHQESGPERSHATLLSKYIREVMERGGLRFEELDAVAVGKGPGSYTGLRIGVSTAKGLSYGRNLPLLSCSTLLTMAHAAHENSGLKALLEAHGSDLLLCPMLDARRMEVYSAFYTPDFKLKRDVAADIIEAASYQDLLRDHPIAFFGNGAPKCQELITHENAHFMEGVEPAARHMVNPIWERFQESLFEDVAYFEPFYLKDFVATIPRKKVL